MDQDTNKEEEPVDLNEQPSEAVNDVTRGCFGTSVFFIILFSLTGLAIYLIFQNT